MLGSSVETRLKAVRTRDPKRTGRWSLYLNASFCSVRRVKQFCFTKRASLRGNPTYVISEEWIHESSMTRSGQRAMPMQSFFGMASQKNRMKIPRHAKKVLWRRYRNSFFQDLQKLSVCWHAAGRVSTACYCTFRCHKTRPDQT